VVVVVAIVVVVVAEPATVVEVVVAAVAAAAAEAMPAEAERRLSRRREREREGESLGAQWTPLRSRGCTRGCRGARSEPLPREAERARSPRGRRAERWPRTLLNIHPTGRPGGSYARRGGMFVQAACLRRLPRSRGNPRANAEVSDACCACPVEMQRPMSEPTDRGGVCEW